MKVKFYGLFLVWYKGERRLLSFEHLTNRYELYICAWVHISCSVQPLTNRYVLEHKTNIWTCSVQGRNSSKVYLLYGKERRLLINAIILFRLCKQTCKPTQSVSFLSKNLFYSFFFSLGNVFIVCPFLQKWNRNAI